VSEAPWRVQEKTELTRCDRQVASYAELPATDVGQASRSWEKARSALLLGDLEKARDLMCRAVLMHPESMALEGLAEIYLTLGSPEQAKLWVETALRLRPERQKTRELLGDIENQRGRLSESREIWVKALSLVPEDQKTLDWLSKKLVDEAQGALRAGSAHRAELLYRRSATLSTSNADAPAGLARLSLKAGNQEQAARWVKVALERAPGHSDAQVVQGDLALARGDSESARQSYQSALEKNPFNRNALEQLARLDRK
jgi:tetratricopeptide (TPR) repeat protein